MNNLVAFYIREFHRIKEKGDIESDEFNNALLLQKTINDLYEKGVIADLTMQIIEGIAYGYTYNDLAELLGISVSTLILLFRKVTDQLGFILGDEFSVLGLLEDDIRVEHISNLPVKKIIK